MSMLTVIIALLSGMVAWGRRAATHSPGVAAHGRPLQLAALAEDVAPSHVGHEEAAVEGVDADGRVGVGLAGRIDGEITPQVVVLLDFGDPDPAGAVGPADGE